MIDGSATAFFRAPPQASVAPPQASVAPKESAAFAPPSASHSSYNYERGSGATTTSSSKPSPWSPAEAVLGNSGYTNNAPLLLPSGNGGQVANGLPMEASTGNNAFVGSGGFAPGVNTGLSTASYPGNGGLSSAGGGLDLTNGGL
ncbi:Aste57867_10674 [Aphanomyces stellatus]|uniref:Aste57867_10674 protein n=1 Tax=Aphanomyces stellatus TaxID=120398 RepID=A0A485KRI7_9STRA|nr:hypothetical protein As57867_010634 [Aphanomyces stellatus]VFT87546.1 Aste57867_10674 [Aphanomyces stellatus]